MPPQRMNVSTTYQKEEVSPEVELVLVEATSALVLMSLGQNMDYLVYPWPTTRLGT